MANFARVFEKVVHNQLRLIIAPKLSNKQYGFLANRNIEINLMEFTVHINNAFENHSQIDVFYGDLVKAFDKVRKSTTICKLAKYPISNTILKWFQSYFQNRKQFVRVGAATSESFFRHRWVVYNVDTSKLLYTALVRSILECGSIIWSPHCITHKISIGSVQRLHASQRK